VDEAMTGIPEAPLMPSVATPATDQEIFRQLYPGLRRFAAVVGAVEMDPDDLVQDAITHALAGGRLSRFESPGAYLRRAIVNAACNERRGAGRKVRALLRLRGGMMEAEPAPYPSDADELAQLSPDVRALTYLRLVERLCYDDIAAMLGVSASSARMTVSRALRALRSSNLDSSSAKDSS
jgi:DNA-directed RNA polymerase specialized sigma24 family protein